MEIRFAANGSADGNLLERYQRAANSLRRILESLHAGLERRAAPLLSLGEVLQSNARNGEVQP
jgi:hypothetical protein